MKKVFLSLVVLASSLVASAQMYVGGEVGFWRNYDANNTSFGITPEVGYNLSDNLAIGIALSYDYNYLGNDLKKNAIKVAPYARYTYAKFGNVNLFLDGGLSFQTYKYSQDGESSDAVNAWEIGLKPGLAVNLTSKLSFIAHMGFIGYRDAEDGYKGASWDGTTGDGFGFKLSGNDLKFGLLYNF